MIERGVTFSPTMARSLWRGEKGQTRRLSSSPLARCEPGDRLIVREHWKTAASFDKVKPSALPAHPVLYVADGECTAGFHVWGRFRQGMHMLHADSRMVLIVTEKRIQRLQDIDEADSRAEGIRLHKLQEHDPYANLWTVDLPDGRRPRANYARPLYEMLWDALHGEGAWSANPEVVALTFTVERKVI